MTDAERIAKWRANMRVVLRARRNTRHAGQRSKCCSLVPDADELVLTPDRACCAPIDVDGAQADLAGGEGSSRCAARCYPRRGRGGGAKS